MNVILRKCGDLVVEGSQPIPEPPPGFVVLRVLYCAVCRTDAKMYQLGHRDLKLPRILGHEIAGIDESTGKLYTVWPGCACGACRYCLEERENLCEEMKIIGFHSDGGFAEYVTVPKESLVPVAVETDPLYLTFAEPVACVLNTLSSLQSVRDLRVVIYGGGVLGMVAALIFREKGWQVDVIEQSQEKIGRLREFSRLNDIRIVKDTVDADFDLAINCCDSPVAFSLCITKLRKGGRLLYFSGLAKNEEIDTNLLNLIHYKELKVHGFYGPRRAAMEEAVLFCSRQQRNLKFLIEDVIQPTQIEAVIPNILQGECLKYIVDVSEKTERKQKIVSPEKSSSSRSPAQERVLSDYLETIVQSIRSPGPGIRDLAQKKVDLKTKPLGALGRVEELAVQMCCVQNSLEPKVDGKRMFVFAGDHGVVEEGVSAFPAKVTVQMVENFLGGGAAINCFCNQYGIDLNIVDMGVDGDFDDHPLLIQGKIAKGTENFAIREAMSRKQAVRAIEQGARAFLGKYMSEPCDLVGLGEMGIGNSSSASAIICAATGYSPDRIVGRGTGVDDRGLERKREVIQKGLDLHQLDGKDGLQLLAAVGGYELGGICGAVLAATSKECGVVLDGIISTAAGLLAYLICPAVKPYLIAGHKSVEVGQVAALELMGLQPCIDLDFRLGEGTGAAVAMNLVELSCTMMRDMASFEEAGVDSSTLN